MRLLLDSHALIWFTRDDPQLSVKAKGLIVDVDNEILISPGTFWEIAIKVSIGKLTLTSRYADFIDVCLNRYGFRLLPIEPAHTAILAEMPFPRDHKDPFDRLYVAQAIFEAVPIVSADAILDTYPIQRLW